MSNLYRGPYIDASYQVSIHLTKRFKRRCKCEKLTNNGHQVMAKAHLAFQPGQLRMIITLNTHLWSVKVHLIYKSVMLVITLFISLTKLAWLKETCLNYLT
jgi:hypothetical protein